jgi:hypothetical protein
VLGPTFKPWTSRVQSRDAYHLIMTSDDNLNSTKLSIIPFLLIKSEAIPVTGRGCLQGCEMLKIPHCLDSRLTDGGKVVSPLHRPRSTPHKHYFSVSDTHFC